MLLLTKRCFYNLCDKNIMIGLQLKKYVSSSCAASKQLNLSLEETLNSYLLPELKFLDSRAGFTYFSPFQKFTVWSTDSTALDRQQNIQTVTLKNR